MTSRKSVFLYSKVALKSLAKKAEVDRAVLFAVLDKGWTFIVGPISTLLIATKFTSEIQGFYYSFGSLLALQTFVELSLSVVIVQFASHEWSNLAISKEGFIVGEADSFSRLVSLAHIATKWYLMGSISLVLLLGFGGYIFFSYSPNVTVDWKMPWLTMCVITGLNLYMLPFLSLLEGCNQVSKTNYIRFISGIGVSLSFWIAILSGAGLWTGPISSLIGFICLGALIFKSYSPFFKSLLFSHPIGPQIKWSSNIFPLQWRVALSRGGGYFQTSLFVPVLFHYYGPVVAGQMGMTWSLMAALHNFISAWLTPKIPLFGMFVERCDYASLNRLFTRLMMITLSLACIISLMIWGSVYILYNYGYLIAKRVLPPLPLALFLLGAIIAAITFPMSLYMRAHKQEPLFLLSVLSGALSCLSTVILGKYFSAMGIGAGYFGINIVIVPIMVLVWYRFRTGVLSYP